MIHRCEKWKAYDELRNALPGLLRGYRPYGNHVLRELSPVVRDRQDGYDPLDLEILPGGGGERDHPARQATACRLPQTRQLRRAPHNPDHHQRDPEGKVQADLRDLQRADGADQRRRSDSRLYGRRHPQTQKGAGGVYGNSGKDGEVLMMKDDR